MQTFGPSGKREMSVKLPVDPNKPQRMLVYRDVLSRHLLDEMKRLQPSICLQLNSRVIQVRLDQQQVVVHHGGGSTEQVRCHSQPGLKQSLISRACHQMWGRSRACKPCPCPQPSWQWPCCSCQVSAAQPLHAATDALCRVRQVQVHKYDLLVGADGANSCIRTALAGVMPPGFCRQRAADAEYAALTLPPALQDADTHCAIERHQFEVLRLTCRAPLHSFHLCVGCWLTTAAAMPQLCLPAASLGVGHTSPQQACIIATACGQQAGWSHAIAISGRAHPGPVWARHSQLAGTSSHMQQLCR